jgi:hypothetical protein
LACKTPEKIRKQVLARYHRLKAEDPGFIPRLRAQQNEARRRRLANELGYRQRIREQNRESLHRRMAANPIYAVNVRQKLVRLRLTGPKPEARRRCYEKLKSLVFLRLGNACDCCGETEHRFLTIDHVRGSGREHRRLRNRGQYAIYYDIRESGFDRSWYRLLCMNCNFAMRTGDPCPHRIPLLQLVLV